jgi:hypothetical protein
MFLRCGKNKGDEGSLFYCLLAMAAAATTAMHFSPIPEIWASGNADRSVESTCNVKKAEQRQETTSVDSNETCFHHDSLCEDQDQLTSHLAGDTLFSKNLDSGSRIGPDK